MFIEFRTVFGKTLFISRRDNPLKLCVFWVRISRQVWAYNWRDVSFWEIVSEVIYGCIVCRTNVNIFRGLLLLRRMSTYTMQGKWSDIFLETVEDEIFLWSLCGTLQTIYRYGCTSVLKNGALRLFLDKSYWCIWSQRNLQKKFHVHLFVTSLYWSRQLLPRRSFPFVKYRERVIVPTIIY